MKRILFVILTICICSRMYALQPYDDNKPVSDTLEVYFHQGSSRWAPSYMGNEERMQAFVERFKALTSDKVFNKISKIHIVAGCSPEGLWEYNQRLSKNRASRIRGVLKEYISLPDTMIVENAVGINWAELKKMVLADPNVPYKDEVLEKLEAPEVVRNAQGKLVEVRKLRLMYLRDGEPWRYMYKKFFPTLRSFNLLIVIEWEKLEAAQLEVKKEEQPPIPPMASSFFPIAYPYQLPPIMEQPARNPFYMGVKTNLLYDAVAVPNAGVEFYLGRDWSVTASWMYAWWKHDMKHWYWRVYGGDLGFRKWFGKAAQEKPLTGHHIGLYGQMFTYDFETGGRGYMGGEPGGTMWDQAHYAGGVEYGYALPIGKRLNLDFVIGVGYMGGKYHEYLPEDDCYVWQVTKQRNWFGPTKAEISLVWLWGHGNFNRNKIKKGGKGE